jgi:hypothetical protein
MSTPEQSGDALAQLVLDQVTATPARVYASHVRGKITFPAPSQLAQSDDAHDHLWRESAATIALSGLIIDRHSAAAAADLTAGAVLDLTPGRAPLARKAGRLLLCARQRFLLALAGCQ